MSIRASLNKNPALGYGAAALLLVGALLALWQVVGGGGAPSGGTGYWYDTGSGDYFAGPSPYNIYGYVAPIDGPSGATAIRAYVYSCTSCDDRASWIVTYQSLTKEGIQLAASETINPDLGERLVAASIVSPDGERWVPMSSAAGRQVLDLPQTQCGEQLQTCYP